MKNQILAFILGVVIAISGAVVAQSITTFSADKIIANTSLASPAITSNNVQIGGGSLGTFGISAAGLSTFYMSDTNAAADTKNWYWQLGNGAGTMRFRITNDINNNPQDVITITRTGLTTNTFNIISQATTISVGGAANAATCWKADGITLGHCTSVVAAGGTCTCA